MSGLCLAQQSDSIPPAQWYRNSNSAESSVSIEGGYLISRGQLERAEPIVRGALLKWTNQGEYPLRLDLRVEATEREDYTPTYLFQFDDEYLSFHAGWRPPALAQDAAFGFDGNPFETRGGEEVKVDDDLVDWVAYVSSLEQGRAALLALKALHRLPDFEAMDSTVIGGLSPFPPSEPVPDTGWFAYHLPMDMERTLTKDGSVTVKLPVRPFPMPLTAARLRVDTEDADAWWLEFVIESGNAADYMGHFQDYFTLAIDGAPAASYGFSIRGSGYTQDPNAEGGGSYTIATGVQDLAEGRRILEGLRRIHDDLPDHAIIDVTRGESHGKLHRFRKAHLHKTLEDWDKLAKLIRFHQVVSTDISEPLWEIPRHLGYLSQMNDAQGLAVDFYVPSDFWDTFEAQSPVGDTLDFEVGTTLKDAVDQVLPPGWMAFPLAPRWIALIPESAVFEGVE